MDLITAKIVVLFLLGIIKLSSGLAPLILSRCVKSNELSWMNKIMAAMMCVGGGVLLSTVFIHMLPEVRENIILAMGQNGELSYPLGELVLCSGFFIIYLIEAAVHRIFNIHGHSHGLPTEKDTNQHDKDKSIKMESFFDGQTNDGYEKSTDSRIKISYITDLEKSTYAHHPMTPIEDKSFDLGYVDNITRSKFATPEPAIKIANSSSVNTTSYVIHGDVEFKPRINRVSSLSIISIKEVWDEKFKEKLILSKIRSFIIVLALSVHSIFEGMAIGLQNDQNGIWKLFAAVSIHECAILFCVGNEMVANGLKKCEIILYMVTLGIVTPIGIAIGIVLTSTSGDSQSSSQILVVGVLQGIAAGTLLYITFYEVLERDKLEAVGMNGLSGAFLIIFGFGFMAGLEASGSHSHEDVRNSTEVLDHLFGLTESTTHGHLH